MLTNILTYSRQDLADQDELFDVVLEKLKTITKIEFESSMVVDNFTVSLSYLFI